MKKCKRCLELKDFDLFGNNKNNSDGKSIYCKECERKRAESYRKANRKKVNESSKKWRDSNPEKYKETIKKYLEKNPHMTSTERSKIYRKDEDFRDKEKERSKKYREENADKVRLSRKEHYHKYKKSEREYNNNYKRNKLKNDPVERAKKNIRDRVRSYLIGEYEGKRTFDIIGLSKSEFRDYIESKFVEGMSWDNYGLWHIDHIKPLCSANDNNEIVELNHYTNLQPLWAEDNIKKNRKYDK